MRKPSFIKSFRVAAALTQADVARHLKISPATFARYENGDGNLPANKVAALARLLHTTPERLTDKVAARNYETFVNKVWRASSGRKF